MNLLKISLILTVFMLPIKNSVASSEAQNKVVKTFRIKASQGVAVGKNHFYAISNTRITKHEKQNGKLVSIWQADPKDNAQKHFKHLNSGTVIGDRLYCAHSRFPLDPNNNSIEIWNIQGTHLRHEKTIRLPKKYGSFTWIDQHSNGSWWMCFAVYGRNKNKETKLVQYEHKENKFVAIKSWSFPEHIIAQWGRFSCSGGSWGPDGLLYTTGHDHDKAYVLQINADNQLNFVRIEKSVGFNGQAIAWDRFSPKPRLWGIVRNKSISLTHLPLAAKRSDK